GKVDRRALPVPKPPPAVGVDARALSPTEEVLASIWSEVLKIDRVGRDDDFFDLGGHSLLAMRVMARVREAFAVELPLRVLFEARTIAALSERIELARREGAGLIMPPLVAQLRGQRLPLSFAQERLWLLERLDVAGSTYNIPAVVRLSGRLDVDALERA